MSTVTPNFFLQVFAKNIFEEKNLMEENEFFAESKEVCTGVRVYFGQG